MGFDVISIAKNATLNKLIIGLLPSDYLPFMRAACALKERLEAEGKSVHPLSLFLGAAMQTGNSELIGLGNKVLSSYGVDNQVITKVFGWHWGGRAANKTELSLYQATGRLGDLPRKVSSKSSKDGVLDEQFKNLAPAYLTYILNPSQKVREKVTDDTRLNSYLQRALFPDSLLDIEKKTLKFTGLPQAVVEQVVESLPTEYKDPKLLHVSKPLEAFVSTDIKAYSAYAEAKTKQLARRIIASRADDPYERELEHNMREGNHPLADELKNILIDKIKRALADGAIITRPVPEFLQDVFKNPTERVLRPLVDNETCHRSILEHIKTRAPWVVKGSTVHDQTVLSMADNYDVLDYDRMRAYLIDIVTNREKATVKPFLIAPINLIEDRANNKADDVRFILEAKPSTTLVVDYGDAETTLKWHGFNISNTLAASVQHLSFVGGKITHIGDRFLCGFSSLQSVDLSGLRDVTNIEGFFLACCSKLESINLAPFSKVISIGHGFLSDCTSLASVDLSRLRNVTSIADYFLAYCSNLTSVDLRDLSEPTQSTIRNALRRSTWSGTVLG